MTIEPVDQDPRPVSKSAPGLPRWTVPVVAVVVLVVAGVVLVLLWQWIDGLALSDPEKKAAAHLEAVKVASAFVVGGGGVFALYLAVRRQRTQEQELAARRAELAHAERVAENSRLLAERTAAATEHDAAQRRITELYTAAAMQLGSDKAPVRLAGLYAIERLAQDNPAQRQTIVNVLCAYLRMPYTRPTDFTADESMAVDQDTVATQTERVQELEVRLTAQRVLTAHLRLEDGADRAETFWADIDLDLTGAFLLDLDLRRCHLGAAQFTEATLAGDAEFNGARITGHAQFDGAKFSAGFFDGAKFDRDASFMGAEFGPVEFNATEFAGGAHFDDAIFVGGASFAGAKFDDATSVSNDDASSFPEPGDRNYGHVSFWGTYFEHGVPHEVERFWSPPAAADSGDTESESIGALARNGRRRYAAYYMLKLLLDFLHRPRR